jgi:hypothetical protein
MTTAAINEMELWTNEYGILLPDHWTVRAIPYKKGCKYEFYTQDKIMAEDFPAGFPLQITELSTVGRKIKEHLNPNGTLAKKGVSQKFTELKIALNNFVDEYIDFEIQKEEKEKLEKLESNKKELEKTKKIFENSPSPILWIASLIDWYTAGERLNILIAFFCFCSQVILKNPISVVGLGEGSSGKTHVMEEALSLIPGHFILREKKPTLASVFRRAEIDQYYYDGKIVVYGDLGGDNDQEEVLETKSIIKELQTDGYVNRPITVKMDGGFEVVDLELKGTPCLGYTTVPNYEFDTQELSRSLIYTPRTDNRNVFNERKNILELKGGVSEKQYQEYLGLKDIIQNIVIILRQRFDEVKIINPYSESIFDFIGDTEYYKRDYDKYNSILKCITAFNSNNREVKMINNQKVMFTNPEDIKYFITLFEHYTESITSNLSPKATEIFNDINKNIGSWRDSMDYEGFDFGITVSDYMELGNVDLTKRSLQRYFSELNGAGFLKVVDKRKNTNVYNLSKELHDATSDDLLVLSGKAKKRIGKEYGVEFLDYIEGFSGMCVDDISIKSQADNVIKPDWLEYDKEEFLEPRHRDMV